MASTLYRDPFLRRSLNSVSTHLPWYRRLAHNSRKSPSTAHSEIPGYQRVRFRDIKLDQKKICLWRGDEKLGILPMTRVMTEFLGPGKALSWLARLEPQTPPAADGERKRPVKAAHEILDYEVISIPDVDIKPDSALVQKIRQDKMHQVFFQSNEGLAGTALRTQLAVARSLFNDPENGARYPVKFNIINPPGEQTRYNVNWALRRRIDLHPEVLKLGMPYGVDFTIKPHMQRGEKEVIWWFAGKHYKPKAKEDSGKDSSRAGDV